MGCALGGLAGHPQVSIPGASLPGGLPVGLSIVGARGQDASLVAVAKALAAMADVNVVAAMPSAGISAVNIPEVVAEVKAAFERYENALVENDIAVLDDTFWHSPHTIRYAGKDVGYGFDAIHQHRTEVKPGPDGKVPSK